MESRGRGADHRAGASGGSFARQLMLGDHLRVDDVKASYDDGVLTLEIPVAETAKPRKVEVRAASQQAAPIDVESTQTSAGSERRSARSAHHRSPAADRASKPESRWRGHVDSISCAATRDRRVSTEACCPDTPLGCTCLSHRGHAAMKRRVSSHA